MSKSSLPTTRFTIRVGNADQVILTARLNKKGDVYLTTRTGAHYRNPGSSAALYTRINEVHFSIHVSRDSPEQINVITGRLRRSDGQIERSRFHTKAIKSGKAFSFFAIRRCPSLDTETFALKSQTDLTCSLGSYSPEMFSLIFGLFVGAKGVSFDASPTWLNTTQRTFGDVELILAWTFFPFPSSGDGFIRRFSTFDPNQPELLPAGITVEQAKRIIEGHTPEVCIQGFRGHCFQLLDESIRSIWPGPLPKKIEYRPEGCRLFKSGRIGSPEHIAYLKNLARPPARP
jgi:hypothetical protein